MPQDNLVSNEQHEYWKKKADRAKELEQDELVTKISLDEEILRLEKYEGDIAARIIPELMRLGSDQSRKINEDIYNYVVRGVYLDPKRRIELYNWIRTVVFKYDEFVIAMQKLDVKKEELMQKAVHYAKDLENTNEALLEELSELRNQANEKSVDDPVVEIPFENRSLSESPVKIQENVQGVTKDLSPTINEEPVVGVKKKPDAARPVPEKRAIIEKPRIEKNEEKSLEVIYLERLQTLRKNGGTQTELDAVHAEYRQKKKERDGR